MHIDIAAVPARELRPNEDYAAVALPAQGRGGVAVVLDGVTPPPDGDTGCAHDVAWFTARLGGALLELAGSRQQTLSECLSEAIARTAAAHGTGCDLAHPRTPQATVAALRWDDERVEHLVLADAILIVGGRDGAVTSVRDDRLTRLRRRPGLSLGQLRNTEGGFFTAAADPGVSRRAVTGVMPLPGVADAAILTDGAARWCDLFALGGHQELLDLVRSQSLSALIGQVRAAERADPDSARFPRSKRHDDAAGVYVRLADAAH